MFNSVVLDVFIGLVFIYLLYSLLATILQEMLARWFSLRTHNLTFAIRMMLEDRKESDKSCGIFTAISRFFKMWVDTITHFFDPLPDKTFTKAFYHHPIIKYLGENQWRRKPAYLQPETFSQALIQLLRGDQFDGTRPQINCIEDTLFLNRQITAFINQERTTVKIDDETLRHLQLIFIDSNRDIDRFKSGLENWFKETMDRATGWYKKTVQRYLLIIGFALAASFNVDTIAIYKLLSVNRTARNQMVQLATAGVEKYKVVVAQTSSFNNRGSGDTTQQAGRDTIYVSDTTLNKLKEEINDDIQAANNLFSISSKKYQTSDLLMYAGWILTALAISLGAPFWFDLLSKLIQLRGTGPKPANDDSAANTSTPDNNLNPRKRVG